MTGLLPHILLARSLGCHSSHSGRDRAFDRIGIGELEQTRHPLASHLSDGNMRAPPVVGSESASVDPVGRGIVLP